MISSSPPDQNYQGENQILMVLSRYNSRESPGRMFTNVKMRKDILVPKRLDISSIEKYLSVGGVILQNQATLTPPKCEILDYQENDLKQPKASFDYCRTRESTFTMSSTIVFFFANKAAFNCNTSEIMIIDDIMNIGSPTLINKIITVFYLRCL